MGSVPPAQGHKNILLLVADDLGRELMGCYGNDAIQTPNLDALAASGVRFDMAFTSTASCSGSRTVLYTGLHTHENGCYGLTHGKNGFQTFDTVETAPEAFNRIGYKTGILGKIHTMPESKYPYQYREESDSRNTAWVADQARGFFRDSITEDKPFFLTIGFVDPHREIGQRGGFGNIEGNYDHRLEDKIYDPSKVHIPHFLSDVPEVRNELSEYYRAIYRMDQGIGLILKCLEAEGLADSTLVLFLSDNGPPFINSKTTLYEAGVRLPFLLRAPGLTSPGVVNSNLVSYIDVLPTLLNWAGHADLNAPKGMIQRRGRSILPIVNSSGTVDGWDHVFGSHTFHEITNYWPTRYMRNRRFKYHRNVCWKLDFPFAMDLYASLSFEGMRNSGTPEKPAMIGPRTLESYICRPPEELYDLENDPQEICNLAQEPKFKAVLEEMRDALERWQLETGDLWLWRDGAPVVRYVSSSYVRQGLKIPDRFNFEAGDPSTTNKSFTSLV